MAVKPDDIISSSTLPNYINIGTVKATLAIFGVVLNNTSVNFTGTAIISSKANRVDIYGTNLNNNNKQLISTSNFISNDVATNGGIYQHKNTEFVELSTSQSSTNVSVIISINNFTGASVTLITQTILISVVEYQIPF